MGRMLLWPDDGVAVHCEECRDETLSVELRDGAGCWDAGDRRGRVMGGDGLVLAGAGLCFGFTGLRLAGTWLQGQVRSLA